jgi:hypothetical protein
MEDEYHAIPNTTISTDINTKVVHETCTGLPSGKTGETIFTPLDKKKIIQ